MTYFNTTNEQGKLLKEYRQKAENQTEFILRYIRQSTIENKDYKTSAWDLWDSNVFNEYPITSIRRSINTLVNQGDVIYTGEKRKGLYGRNESIIKLN
jgi:hypothetical protein